MEENMPSLMRSKPPKNRFDVECQTKINVMGLSIDSGPQKMSIDVYPDGSWRCHLYNGDTAKVVFNMMPTKRLMEYTKKRLGKKKKD
jgi:hypothetical protein